MKKIHQAEPHFNPPTFPAFWTPGVGQVEDATGAGTVNGRGGIDVYGGVGVNALPNPHAPSAAGNVFNTDVNALTSDNMFGFAGQFTATEALANIGELPNFAGVANSTGVVGLGFNHSGINVGGPSGTGLNGTGFNGAEFNSAGLNGYVINSGEFNGPDSTNNIFMFPNVDLLDSSTALGDVGVGGTNELNTINNFTDFSGCTNIDAVAVDGMGNLDGNIIPGGFAGYDGLVDMGELPNIQEAPELDDSASTDEFFDWEAFNNAGFPTAEFGTM